MDATIRVTGTVIALGTRSHPEIEVRPQVYRILGLSLALHHRVHRRILHGLRGDAATPSARQDTMEECRPPTREDARAPRASWH